MRYEWKSRADVRETDPMDTPAKITVIVPLFPRHPGIRRSLASLREQTIPPDFVVLIDHGIHSDAEYFGSEIPGVPVTIAQVDTGDLAEGINRTVEFLDQSEFVAVLTSGAAYAPTRLEQCLRAMEDSSLFRTPGLAVTGQELVDSQGEPLGWDDPRRGQLDRLWAHVRAGVSSSESLGAGDFVLAASNLFARRSYLAGNPLAAGTFMFPYFAAVQAAVQGSLLVLEEPLLELNWPGPEPDLSAPASAAVLRAQLEMLGVLREKLATSPETRRNFAAFRRACWSNISGLREDIFTQAAMQMASLADRAALADAMERMGGARDFIETPPQLRDFRAGEAQADPAAYAAALARTRAELAELRAEHERLRGVAEAAQDSGWVRLGAWLGDRSARRIMEMDQDEAASIQPPNGEVESGGENNPNEIGHQQP